MTKEKRYADDRHEDDYLRNAVAVDGCVTANIAAGGCDAENGAVLTMQSVQVMMKKTRKETYKYCAMHNVAVGTCSHHGANDGTCHIASVSQFQTGVHKEVTPSSNPE